MAPPSYVANASTPQKIHMKLIRPTSDSGFTLIELLVVISIIAILAGIALPVFGEVQTRGAQTKALANAKQVGLACKVFAQDYNGLYPNVTDLETRTGTPQDANAALQVLLPDYIPDRSIFAIAKSEFSKNAIQGKNGGGDQTKLPAGYNEWAYVIGLSDTSNARYPLLADGFVPGSESGNPKYAKDDTKPGGVWKAKKAVVVRVDNSAGIEVCVKEIVPRNESERNKNLFSSDPSANPPWLSGTDVKVLNPIAP